MRARRWAITGGEVVDGIRSSAELLDIVVHEGRIEHLQPPEAPLAANIPTLDATGLMITPGFIDVHSHADNAPFLEVHDTSKILQGVTTEVVGNCGFSLGPGLRERAADLQGWVEEFFPAGTPSSPDWPSLMGLADEHGYVTNHAPLVGHGALRAGTVGTEHRPASPVEIESMVAGLREAAEAGAFGFSSGLIYTPGSYADPAELQTLAGSLPPSLPYVTHVRGEGTHVRQSILEALDVAQRGTPVHISHLKVAGRGNWGRMPELLEVIDHARDAGHDIRQDVYPYTAGSTILAAVLPPWTRDGGRDATLRRLTAPGTVDGLQRDLRREDPSWDNLALGSGWDAIVIASSSSGRLDGCTIAEIAERESVSEVRALVDVLVAEELEATMVIHSMSEPDLRDAVTHPATMIGSDGLPPGVAGLPHPRQFGTFPRVLGHLVRQQQWIPLAEAVRRMTSLPAQAFGLKDRGRIQVGHVADLVAFDPSTVLDTATYTSPAQDPIGIAWVTLSGRVVVKDGVYLGGRHGCRLTPS